MRSGALAYVVLVSALAGCRTTRIVTGSSTAPATCRDGLELEMPLRQVWRTWDGREVESVEVVACARGHFPKAGHFVLAWLTLAEFTGELPTSDDPLVEVTPPGRHVLRAALIRDADHSVLIADDQSPDLERRMYQVRALAAVDLDGDGVDEVLYDRYVPEPDRYLSEHPFARLVVYTITAGKLQQVFDYATLEQLEDGVCEVNVSVRGGSGAHTLMLDGSPACPDRKLRLHMTEPHQAYKAPLMVDDDGAMHNLPLGVYQGGADVPMPCDPNTVDPDDGAAP